MGLGNKYYRYGYNNYYSNYPILYYALAVELDKPETGDLWSGINENPLSIETFDLTMSDYTDDTATVTISGKLSRDLIDREADEETLSRAYKESLSLAVGDKITKLYASDIADDGSFTIALEGATLDANIVLATQAEIGGTGPAKKDKEETEEETEEEVEYEYGYEFLGYETLYVPLLQMPISKIWTDSKGNTGAAITAKHKDDVVVVDVKAGDKVVRTAELTSKTDPAWEKLIKGLPEYTHYERGKKPEKIAYKPTEREIKGYSTKYGQEESSKYLEIGEKITEDRFTGKYILLGEAAKMALTVEDGEIVARPYDTDDEYQKWTTVPYTYANAYIGMALDDEGNPIYPPIFGDYDVLLIKNDKTGKFLAIAPSGPKLIDEETAHDSPEAAIYVVSPTTGNAIIRSVGFYDRGVPMTTDSAYVRILQFSYGNFDYESYGYWPIKNYATGETLSFTLVAHWAVVPSKYISVYGWWPDTQNYSTRSYFETLRAPWKFLALHWSDAEMKNVYTVTSSSSVLVNVAVYDESKGLLYKVTNTPNSLTIEKELEFGDSSTKTVDEETFYIALFSDRDRTERVADIPVQELKISDSSSGKIMIEGIPAGTYYVGETDRNGKLLTEGTLSDGSRFEPEYGNYTVTIASDGGGGATYSFTNIIIEDPNTADIIVTKKLVDKDTGKDVNVEGKYSVYVALFKDEAHTMRVSGIERIDISGTSSGTAVFKDVEEGTYYVGETDANGNKLVAAVLSPAVGFVAEYSEGDKVEIKGDTEKAEVTFTNQFTTPPEDPEDPPKTGDTNINWFNTWVVSGLLLAAAVIDLIKSRIAKRSEEE